jgi:hypothetical protein
VLQAANDEVITMAIKFILEPYRGKTSRHTCPACHRSGQFARYIHVTDSSYVADHVGRCNRENRCGYHYTPGKFFRDRPRIQEPKRPEAAGKTEKHQTDIIPIDLMKKSLTDYDHNHFVQWLKRIFHDALGQQLVDRFRVGTARRWPGATVFWQMDREGKVRTGKIMYFDPATGKRIKDENGQSEIDWVHSILLRKKMILSFSLMQCFFGEHQLACAPADQPAAIVESEKTAMIASVYFPDFIWLAAGQLNGLSVQKFAALSDRQRVILYPDLGVAAPGSGMTPFQKWSQRAAELRRIYKIDMSVSDILETHVSSAQERINGLDLADYLIRTDPEFGWALKDGYPAFWDAVDEDASMTQDDVDRQI